MKQPGQSTRVSVDNSTPSEKPLKKGQLLDISIDSLSYGGEGVTRLNDGFVVLTNSVIPGEKVRVRIIKSKKNLAKGAVVERLEESHHYIPPKCPHVAPTGCGGCQSQHLEYLIQLSEKQKQVEYLFRDGMISGGVPQVEIIQGCEKIFGYRNKMEFSFGTREWLVNPPEKKSNDEEPNSEVTVQAPFILGLRPRGHFDKTLSIDACYLQHEQANQVLDYVRNRLMEVPSSVQAELRPYDNREHTGTLRNLAIRSAINTDGQLELMVNFVTSPQDVTHFLLQDIANALPQRIPEVKSVMQNMTESKGGATFGECGQKVLFGREYIEQDLLGYSFQISANSFFQTNPYQASVLYKEIQRHADLNGDEIVHDLFCGTGSIGICLAEKCRQVIGIELVESAVEDARRNAKRNNITNASFYADNLDKSSLIESLPKADVVVIDPPRAGCHPSLIKHLINTKPRKIVYVSCNPASQVRDIQLLSVDELYKLAKVSPVDMFPHTPHIESVVTLELHQH
eukprot:CAMPEP_0182444156 /NCGR_PEP_ID=MMETSP1172-20130603/2701_1 /TAXON_ID=708627 /ORGANISM="Timspurckia oligopyrenoides, Strain CCMP3278" /LENGTH=511 /DNA_ID=CAMNT_0024639661 /DNA_START=136 /DNA_END=1671 /DNA_ORIENTATION=-